MTPREEALTLAARGWAVLPCDWRNGDRSKAPLTKHGHLEATRSPAIINEWWEEWPDALIGGRIPKGALVLDVDPRNGGSREKLIQAMGQVPRTLSVVSGRGDGGRHLYFERPTNMDRFTSTRLPEGIDLKVNGYCILPPSPHPVTGDPYLWVPGDIAPLPGAAVRILTPPPRKPRIPGEKGNVVGLANTVANADPGSRNDLLFWAARTAHEEGMTDEDFETLASAGLHAGLTDPEVRRTIASAREQYGDQA